ncbi:MAG: ABC transporter ATP-binding protein [Bradyrhizobium sp.]
MRSTPSCASAEVADPLLTIRDLKVEFSTRNGRVTALDGISLDLMPGETLGIVGESGCGKSITALATMGLIPDPPGRIADGQIMFDGEDITRADAKRLKRLRGADISMIFQEPMTSLNPVFTAGDQIAEAIMLHQSVGKAAAHRIAVELLRTVGIPEPEQRARSYPHELSGGMRQRVMIAMAISCRPRVLIADEPTTALDVTVQAQIFDLMREIQTKFGVAILLITHDMGAIAEMADQVVVMYAGRVVEKGSADSILDNPRHPYTRGLIGCIPVLGKEAGQEGRMRPLAEIPGIVPPLHLLGRGCAFVDRCPLAFDRCRTERPIIEGDAHKVACFAAEREAP